ncbi:hypothetical protein X737_31325 [Mesorhizobium sp. L48C026A00]|nr:hypothetical protein X737_31325 [Mesorhizobium sp. L48C026A00]
MLSPSAAVVAGELMLIATIPYLMKLKERGARYQFQASDLFCNSSAERWPQSMSFACHMCPIHIFLLQNRSQDCGHHRRNADRQEAYA